LSLLSSPLFSLQGLLVPIEVVIPYSKGEDLNLVHEVGAVDFVEYKDEGSWVAAKVPQALAMRLKQWEVGGEGGRGEEEGEEETEEDMWKRVAKKR
jgi:hypothetical protein